MFDLNTPSTWPKAALGCMRISALDEQSADALIREALASGITFFDHADIYGKGECESLFGRVLQKEPSLRGRMVLQTKCGIRPGYYDSSKEHIVSSVENSLRRLKTDRVDLLLIHRPDTLAEPEEIAEAFEYLFRRGMVTGFGVSNHSPMQMELLQSAFKKKLLVNQMQLSLMHTPMLNAGFNVNINNAASLDHDGGVLPYLKRRGMALQCWSPFQYGFMEGVFLDSPAFPAVNEALHDMGEKYGVSPAAVAAAWLMRIPCNTQVIFGTTRADRLKDMAAAAALALSREDWYSLYRTAGNRLP